VTPALPADFLAEIERCAYAYLTSPDPIRQSGFGGGSQRWREKREPILNGITHSGPLLDIGCANGHLLDCLAAWGSERNLALEPFGVDYSDKLIALAQDRLPQWRDRFFVGNAWDWTPPTTFDFVYSLYGNVPANFLAEYIQRLLDCCVGPQGRLIIGAYGSRTRNVPAFDVSDFLKAEGFVVSGSVDVGPVPEARFAWVDEARYSSLRLMNPPPPALNPHFS